MTIFPISSTFDFNSIGQDFIENPFPTCQALREYSPMHRNADGSLFLTRYADVLQVYRDPLMSSDKKITFEKNLAKLHYMNIIRPALYSTTHLIIPLFVNYYRLASLQENWLRWNH
jgi:hypothetical protein